MKILLTLFFSLFTALSVFAAEDPLLGLANRILPGYEKQFVFKTMALPTGEDYFELSSVGRKIEIQGNSPVSLASGLNWYLKYYCNASFSWCGNQAQLPAKLPILKEKIRMQTPLHTGFYLNYCTFSYSMPFWGWKEWEQEIDRMAMNGINTPMAMVGVESVWRNTLKRFQYSEQEIKEFIPGPAYQGWFLMGNLEGMGGPLPDCWFDRQEKLQQQIVERMRQYGMEPVFQAFFGMVPRSLSTKYPEADIIGQGKWINFDRPSVLNPIDPLFDEMAKAWYEEYEKLYGTTRYYGGDLFHEGGKTENIDVTEAAECVQEAMQEAVPGSIWVLQSWGGNPLDKLLSRLSKKHSIVVDLCAEYWDRWNERNAFGGFPWVWANITNWGGNVGLHGRLDAIASEPIKARVNAATAPWLKGIGNVPEGIGTNPVVFDLACEMRWRDTVPNMTVWLHDYATYRYGRTDETLNKAWNIFQRTAYGTYKGHRRPSESYLCARPSLKVRTVSAWGSARIYYEEAEFEEGVKLFASVKNQYKGCDAYEYDLIDFTRQLVANKGRTLYHQIVRSYKDQQADSVAIYSKKFLYLILLQDQLLAHRPELSVDTWINQARDCVADEVDKDLFEYNARLLITTWSVENGSLIDYAHREWSGLLKEYYYPRWKLFFEWLDKSIKGEVVAPPDYYLIEQAWTKSRIIPTTSRADLYHLVDSCIDFK